MAKVRLPYAQYARMCMFSIERTLAWRPICTLAKAPQGMREMYVHVKYAHYIPTWVNLWTFKPLFWVHLGTYVISLILPVYAYKRRDNTSYVSCKKQVKSLYLFKQYLCMLLCFLNGFQVEKKFSEKSCDPARLTYWPYFSRVSKPV